MASGWARGTSSLIAPARYAENQICLGKGIRNRQDRLPGLTHDEDGGELPDSGSDDSNGTTEKAFDAEARQEFEQLKQRHEQGDLINFRDIISGEKDFHLRYPQNRSLGGRYVLDCTENGVKNEQNWPANIAKRKKEGEVRREKASHTADGVEVNESEDAHEESDWKRSQGENIKHTCNAAYAATSEQSRNDERQESEYERLLERYTPQDVALLRNLQHEKDYRKQLRHNDGKRKSPQKHNRSTVSIDEADQFSPDNWLPRSEHLIRLTGKHPLNAEAELTTLFDGGLITPNELHYVPGIMVPFRNHELDVENGKLKLSMDDLKNNFESINTPVSLACDGNRRKELDMIKRSKGFNWGAGATGCVNWKGPLLRDVLLAAGVEKERYTGEIRERWVKFQRANEPSEGKYEMCIPLSYAMDPTNDVLLAYERSDVP
ncbi:hypothetical protein LTR17_000136 [Elasticomyces elasticus]|nr:hypothetical protein LTR17_000136 [Elasticomyces elasticus]